ncbi:terminase small subunit [Salmonella enterica]|nr:terminase small subunit [Salmonella enterica]EHZ5697789.1 terminase small subunit [Salmonella enterica]EID6010170.1 terminase small subunit [Salmonella enterica]EIF2474367.1 terminase small subunit [Salmonella enterica]
MKVNKKQLAEIFGRDVRTITTWQSQGLPMISGGGNRVWRTDGRLDAAGGKRGRGVAAFAAPG